MKHLFILIVILLVSCKSQTEEEMISMKETCSKLGLDIVYLQNRLTGANFVRCAND